MTVILCSQQSASLRFEYGICIRPSPLSQNVATRSAQGRPAAGCLP